ncbi:MAG: hypothetical protein V1934_01110 [Methanobacteriota archaeon]
MIQNNDWQAKKEALRAQAEALRAQEAALRAQAEKLGRQQAEEEKKMAVLERTMGAPPRRGEDPYEVKERYRQAKAEYQAAKMRVKAFERVEREMERAEEAMEDIEDELSSVEEEAEESLEEVEDEADAEFPDLAPIERKIQKAMERIKVIDFAGLEAGMRDAIDRGLAPLAPRPPAVPSAPSAPQNGIGFDMVREQMGGRANTIMTRVSDEDLQTLDILVEAGLASSRSECAAMLLHEGIIARKDMIQKVRDTADQIRKLRDSMREELRSVAAASPSAKKEPGSE